MMVGYMSNRKKPGLLAELISKLGKHYNTEILYLTPDDVDIESGMVKGKFMLSHEWINVTTNLPKIIDISPYCFNAKNIEITKYLKKNTYLTDNRTNPLTKEKLQRLLLNEKDFSHLLIQTAKVPSVVELNEFINKYNTVVLKPVGGEKGRGVYIIEKNKDNYILGYQKRNKELSYKQLEEFVKDYLDSTYIMQKYISSRSIQGDPFDCRIHLEKNGNGEWEVAKKYIRIGIGQKVVSNISQGGGISDSKPFLKANFGNKGKEIERNLNRLAATYPYKHEEYRGTDMITMGLDVGIDKDGDLYLFEVNAAPITSPLLSQVATLRIEYYNYLINNKL